MYVKYIGHSDAIYVDFDGKRYTLSKKRPILEIPQKVYDFIMSSEFIFKHDIVYIPPPKEDNKDEEIEDSEYVKKEDVENDVIKKKPGRPKKGN